MTDAEAFLAKSGWRPGIPDVATLLEVYQAADDVSVLSVTSETRKLTARGLMARPGGETDRETETLATGEKASQP